MTTREIFCEKLRKQAPGLSRIPYPGALGQRIFEHVSQEAWQAWLRHQTLLINENRLNLLEPQTRIWLGQQMEAYFFGEGSAVPMGYQAPKKVE